MNNKIILIILLAIISFSIGFLANNLIFTGQTIQNTDDIDEKKNTLTKAICNENNECIDVLITCINKMPTNIKPVSNLTQLPENWTDTRENKELCE